MFGGMPIEIVRRRMIIIIGTIVSEAKDPTRNVILDAAVSGIACYDRPYGTPPYTSHYAISS